MSSTDVNGGAAEDIAKLMIHRLIARQIRRDPTLVERAKIVHARQADRFAGWPFVHEWDERRLRIKLPRDQDRLPMRGRWKTFEGAAMSILCRQQAASQPELGLTWLARAEL